MSGSAAPLLGFPFGSTSITMNNHYGDPSYSSYAGASIGSGDGTYLGGSVGAGPSTLPASASFAVMNGATSQGESTPNSSKRPFPWASSQERDKRARSCDGAQGHTRSGSGGHVGMRSGNMPTFDQRAGGSQGEAQEGPLEANDDEAEETMSTGESAYASAAESPQFNQSYSQSPTQAGTPSSWPLASVDEYRVVDSSTQHEYSTHIPDTHIHSNPLRTSPAPRIPTPAGLRTSSPLDLPDLSSSSSASAPMNLTPAPAFASSSPNLGNSPTAPLVSARPVRLSLSRSSSVPSRTAYVSSMHTLGEPRNQPQYDINNDNHRRGPQNHQLAVFQQSSRNTDQGRSLDLGWLTQQLDQALPAPRSLEPFSSIVPLETSISASTQFPVTHPARQFSASFGSASVDSALPLPVHNRSGTGGGLGREPLPWVDIEPEGDDNLLLNSVSASVLSDGVAGSISHDSGDSSSGFGDGVSSGVASPGANNFTSIEQTTLPNFQSNFSPQSVVPELSTYAGHSSPQEVESVASTVRSERSTLGNQNMGADAEAVHPGENSTVPNLSPVVGGSTLTRTVTSRNNRRPLSLNLRAIPTSPAFSVSSFQLSGPVSGSPSFIVSESPTFPASASPRTSAFDLAITPPGSALPSFVARMMEVDSPVREAAGGDATHTHNISDLTLGSRAENNAASIDALRRFMQQEESGGDQDAFGASPNQALTDVAVGSYFPESPESAVHQEPIPFTLDAGSDISGTGQRDAWGSPSDETPTTPRRSISVTQSPLEASERGTSTLTQITHQAEESWSSRPSDLNSVYSRRLTESGVTYPSRPSDSGASLPSFRATVSPEPELNMGTRPGRVVRDMSWSISELFRPAHEGLRGTSVGSGSETSLRARAGSRERHDTGETRNGGGSRASVRSALIRAVRLGGPTRGSESLPRLHLGALPRRAVSGPIEDEPRPDATLSTNLSRTPPGPSAMNNTVPSLTEAWLEEGSSNNPQLMPIESLHPRGMSTTRWTDLLPQASVQPIQPVTRPPNRTRIPPAVSTSPMDNGAFDPPSGTDWNQYSPVGSVSHVDVVYPDTQIRQESAHEPTASLARYQAFAQSIDEIRRSPLPQPQRNTIITTPSAATPSELNPIRTSALAPGVSWVPRRHEPPPLPSQPHAYSRTPHTLSIDNNQPSISPTQGSASIQLFEPVDENWLRDWEMQRDRRSRAAREDYTRRRDAESPNNRVATSQSGSSRPATAHRPLIQLGETQAQGQVWAGLNSRPRSRPMTRASLVATGFADDDLMNDWHENDDGDSHSTRFWGGIPRPSRRPELLPPRSEEADSPMQFFSDENETASGTLLSESPPSLLQDDFNDSVAGNSYEPVNVNVPQPFSRADTHFNPVDFRTASHALRASLLDASRRSTRESGVPPSHSEAFGSSLDERPVTPNDSLPRSLRGFPVTESERPPVSVSSDGWEAQIARSQIQLERMRQLLHYRSGDSQEPRRHISDLSHPTPAQPRRRSFLPAPDTGTSTLDTPSESPNPFRRPPPSDGPWPRSGVSDTHSQRPLSLHSDEPPEWASLGETVTHEMLRASSLRGRRRRTLLPESSSRRDSHGFLHSMNNALHQVESGLLHLNRGLHALADQGNEAIRRFDQSTDSIVPQTARSRSRSPSRHDASSRMDWAFEPMERNSSPPPTLPPFDFPTLQHNSDWPASRRNQYHGETAPPTDPHSASSSRRMVARGLDNYFEPRQNSRDSPTRGTRASPAHDNWRADGLSNEWWSNDGSSPSVQLRDRLVFRASGSTQQSTGVTRQPDLANARNVGGSLVPGQQPSTTSGRLHRRRLSPPAPGHQTNSPTSSLLRSFASPATSTSPPRSYASRFSHFLPRRNSGRGGGSSDDNEDWHHVHTAAEQASRRFFLRPRGRTTRVPPQSGDYMRDDEFDDSYEGLLRLAARIGDAKPRGTPAEVIRSMPSCSYATSPAARAETRCPICLDDYAQEDIVTAIKRCSHWFHRECVQQWLSNSRTCPVCRGEVDGEGDSEPQAGPSSNAAGTWM